MERHLDYPDIPYHMLLRNAAARWPDKTAIVFGDQHITFERLDRDVDHFAAALSTFLGLRKGDRLGIYMPNDPTYEIAFLGAARAGVIPTPLNPSYKEREVRHQLDEAGASAIVVYHSLLPQVLAVRETLPALKHVIVVGGPAPEGTNGFDALLERGRDASVEIEFGPDDLAALPFSSGTTGRSKGVMLTQRNLVCNALQFVEATASTEKDVLLIFLPLYHIYGVALMSTAIASGATQVLMQRFDLSEVVQTLQREQVTELFVVPPVMLALANAPGLKPNQFTSLRFIKSAAAPLPAEIARRVRDRLGVRVIQAYGLTESSPLTHMVQLDDESYEGDHVGVVAADTHCRVMDLDTGERELGPGEVGEVCVIGPQIMARYWNAPTETARTVRDGWLYTGDVGYMDVQGRLFIVDRKKEMIKYKAWSIAPAELEAVLLEHPDVLDCAVTARADAEAGEVPYAFVVPRSDAEASPGEIGTFVAERVAGYKQLHGIEIVEAIPRTPSGKILRRVLKERAQSSPT